MSWDAVLIAGPTSSGKSATALALAETQLFDGSVLDGLGAAIVNTDSMQVYTELRVLSARPAPAAEARVPHFLYGHVPVTERYSAGRYHDDVSRVLGELRKARRIPIFTGGTGFYFRVLTEGLSPMPPVAPEIREAVRNRFERLGPTAFFKAFADRDPEAATFLRPSDTQRLLRAASVLEATGRSLKEWQQVQGIPVLNGLRVARFVLAPPRKELYARIDARFAAMMEAGALDEVRALAGLDPSLPAARALGVPQLLAHFEGTTSLESAIALAQAETRRYAKRQLTWLRRFMKDWKWLEVDDSRNIIPILIEKLA